MVSTQSLKSLKSSEYAYVKSRYMEPPKVVEEDPISTDYFQGYVYRGTQKDRNKGSPETGIIGGRRSQQGSQMTRKRKRYPASLNAT
jgi:hypothetical protein